MLRWLLLAAGALLGALAAPRYSVPFAAWLAPLPLLFFARSERRGGSAFLGVTVAYSVAIGCGLQGVLRLPPGVFWAVVVGSAMGRALPFLADRALAPRVRRRSGEVAASLVFPLAMTSFEYLAIRPSPFGSWGATAYSQTTELSLLQLAAATGVWGFAFLVHWLAPVALALRDAAEGRAAARAPFGVFAGALSVVLVAGGTRVALTPPEAGTSVAALATADSTYDEALAGFRARDLARAPDAERAAAAERFERLWDELAEATPRALAAGARVVSWPETVPVLAEHLDARLAAIDALARERRALVLVTPWIVRRTETHPWGENRSVLLDGSGAPRWRYAKAHPVLGLEASLGPGDALPARAETSLGAVAGVICHDLDFPALARAAARATHHGISAMIDPLGRILARAATGPQSAALLVAPLPTTPRPTLYAAAGDWFAWLSLASLGALVVVARRPAHARTTVKRSSAIPLPPSHR